MRPGSRRSTRGFDPVAPSCLVIVAAFTSKGMSFHPLRGAGAPGDASDRRYQIRTPSEHETGRNGAMACDEEPVAEAPGPGHKSQAHKALIESPEGVKKNGRAQTRTGNFHLVRVAL